jgi:hypothetical protein
MGTNCFFKLKDGIIMATKLGTERKISIGLVPQWASPTVDGVFGSWY